MKSSRKEAVENLKSHQLLATVLMLMKCLRLQTIFIVWFSTIE